MSSVSVVLLIASNVMLMCQIGLPLTEGTYCRSNSDCLGEYFNNVCCTRSYYYSGRCQFGSCVGKSCSTDGDCGGKDECCISNKCTTYGCAECFSNAGCATSEYCCKHRYHNDHNVCRRSCVGETCLSSFDCGGPSEYCTSNKICWKAGRSCSSNSDCRGDGECCRSSKCVTVGCSCSSNFNCASSRYCCKRGFLANVCRINCVGETCHSSSDCGGPSEYCTSNKICWKAGRSCSSSSDCRGDGECCRSSKCVTVGCPCSSNSNCASSRYCCKRGSLASVCRTDCVGQTCYSSDDCGGPLEYCTSYKICSKARRSCSSSSDCRGDGECCRSSKCVTVGCPACTSNSNCASSKYCCKRGSLANVCRTDCVGETCYDGDDCGGPREFCNTNTTKCEKSKTTGAGWVVAVSVVGAVLFVIFVGAIWAYRFCRGSSRRGVVVQREPARRTTAIIALRETETTVHSAPVYNIPPPAYDNHGQNFPSPQTHQLPPESRQGMPQPQHGYPLSQHAYPQQGYLPPQPQHMYPQPQPGYPPSQPEPGYPPPQPQNAYQPPNALH